MTMLYNFHTEMRDLRRNLTPMFYFISLVVCPRSALIQSSRSLYKSISAVPILYLLTQNVQQLMKTRFFTHSSSSLCLFSLFLLSCRIVKARNDKDIFIFLMSQTNTPSLLFSTCVFFCICFLYRFLLLT